LLFSSQKEEQHQTDVITGAPLIKNGAHPSPGDLESCLLNHSHQVESTSALIYTLFSPYLRQSWNNLREGAYSCEGLELDSRPQSLGWAEISWHILGGFLLPLKRKYESITEHSAFCNTPQSNCWVLLIFPFVCLCKRGSQDHYAVGRSSKSPVQILEQGDLSKGRLLVPARYLS
jgi:hypothetical protein